MSSYHGVSYVVTDTKNQKHEFYHTTCYNQIIGYTSRPVVDYTHIKDIRLWFNKFPLRVYLANKAGGDSHLESPGLGCWHDIVNTILGKKLFVPGLIQGPTTHEYHFTPIGLGFAKFKFALFLIRHGFNHPFVLAHAHYWYTNLGLTDRETLWKLVYFLTFHPLGRRDTMKDLTHALLKDNTEPVPVTPFMEEEKDRGNISLNAEFSGNHDGTWLMPGGAVLYKFWQEVEKQELDFTDSESYLNPWYQNTKRHLDTKTYKSYQLLKEQFEKYCETTAVICSRKDSDGVCKPVPTDF